MKPLNPMARRLLDLSQGLDEPDALARDRVAHSLAARIAAGAVVGAVGTALPAASAGAGLGSTAAGLGGVVVKSVLVACVAGAAVTTGWLGLRPSHRATSSARPRPAATAVVMPAAPPEAPPASPTVSAPQSPDLSPHRKPARPSQRPEPKPVTSTAPETIDQLREETEALRSAQQALRDGHAQQALTLLEVQDARFREGVLQQERAAARVLALCQAGSVTQARAQAESFERRWPRSPLIARVRFACWYPDR